MDLTEPKGTKCAVQIAVRQRPVLATDANQQTVSINPTESAIVIDDQYKFVFDNYLGPATSQTQLYTTLVQPLVHKMLKGFHCTVLAYGQTGAGKSHTMGMHSQNFDGQTAGMVPRALTDIFAISIDNSLDSQIDISFIEIYNDKVFDLLNDNNDQNQTNTNSHKFGGTKRTIRCIADARAILEEGNKNRHVRPTNMNANSSRSHAIFTVYTSVKRSDSHTVSAMNLVDLAGSEGVRRTGHQGVARNEGVAINQGLLSIGKVLKALSDGTKVIPYRDNILSTVLKDSLNLNSYLTLLACISPLKDDISESLSTLRFAQNAKSFRHAPQINAYLSDVKKVQPSSNHKTNKTPLRPINMSASKRSTFKPGLSGAKLSTSTCRKAIDSNNTRRPQRRTNRLLSYQERQNFGGPLRQQRHNSVDTLLEGFMNCSTSTDIASHAAATYRHCCPQSMNSYSPIVRRCLEAMQQQINDSLAARFTQLEMSGIAQTEPGVSMMRVSPTTSNTSLFWHNNTLEPVEIATALQVPDAENEPDDDPVRAETNASPAIADTEKDKVESSDEVFVSAEAYDSSPTSPEAPITTAAAAKTATTTTTPDFLFKLPIMAAPKRRISARRHRLSMMPLQPPINRTKCPPISMRRATTQDQTTTPSVRQSPRIAAKRLTMLRELFEEEEVITKKSSKKITTTTNKRKKIDNDITASMLSDPQSVLAAAGSKAVRHSLHKKYVLKLINTGNQQQLQQLPQVGIKTAYQLLTHRSLNGLFKSMEAVGKMPSWRGKSFERFKLANNLL